MPNKSEPNPMHVDTASTTVPLIPADVVTCIREIRVMGTGVGERFTLRHGATTGDGTLVYDFISTAAKLTDTFKVPHGVAYGDGLWVTSIGGTQTAQIWR